MKNYTLPAILVVAIIVAGAFAFVPIEQATAVHTDIINTLTINIAANSAILLTATDPVVNNADTITFDCDADYLLVGLTLDIGDALTGGDDFVVVTIDGDEVANVDLGIGNGAVAILDGLEAAATGTDTILTFTVVGDGADFVLDRIRVSIQTSGNCAFI